jgi:C1A family cysteine protease
MPVARDVAAIKQALQTAGGVEPGSVWRLLQLCRRVYEYALGDYEGGHSYCVGYVDTPGQYGGGYFIVKNSWGAVGAKTAIFELDTARWIATLFSVERRTCIR